MLIHVKVIPSSKRQIVEKISDTKYKVRLQEKAERGEANRSLIEIIGREFGVGSRDVKIITGHKSRNKILEVIY